MIETPQRKRERTGGTAEEDDEQAPEKDATRAPPVSELAIVDCATALVT